MRKAAMCRSISDAKHAALYSSNVFGGEDNAPVNRPQRTLSREASGNRTQLAGHNIFGTADAQVRQQHLQM